MTKKISSFLLHFVIFLLSLMTFSSLFLGEIFSLNINKIIFSFTFYFFLMAFAYLFFAKKTIKFSLKRCFFYLFLIFLFNCLAIVFKNFYFDLAILSNGGVFLMTLIMLLLSFSIFYPFKEEKFKKILTLFKFFFFISAVVGLVLFFLDKSYSLFSFIGPLEAFILSLIFFLQEVFQKKRNKFLLLFFGFFALFQLLIILKFSFWVNLLEIWRINLMYVSDSLKSLKWNFSSIFHLLFGFGNLKSEFLTQINSQVLLSFLLINAGLINTLLVFIFIFNFFKKRKEDVEFFNHYLAFFLLFFFQLFLPIHFAFILLEILLFIIIILSKKNKSEIYKFNLVNFAKKAKVKTLKKMFLLHRLIGVLLLFFSILGVLRLIFLILSFFYLNQGLFYLSLGQFDKYYSLSEKSVSMNIINDNLLRQNAEANLRKVYKISDQIKNSDNDSLKKELQDKREHLVDRSIKKAQQAVVANYSYENLFFLAQLYKNYYGLVVDADKWSNVFFARAALLNDENTNLYSQWASLFVIQEEYDSALKVYEKALKVTQNKSFVYYQLANLMIKMNDVEKSLDYYNLAMQNLEKDSKWYQSNRAQIIKEMSSLKKTSDEKIELGIE